MERYEVREAQEPMEIARMSEIRRVPDMLHDDFDFIPDEFFRYVVEMKRMMGNRVVVIYIWDNEIGEVIGGIVAADFRSPICDRSTVLYLASSAPAEYNEEMGGLLFGRLRDIGSPAIRIETKHPKLYRKYGFVPLNISVMEKDLME